MVAVFNGRLWYFSCQRLMISEAASLCCRMDLEQKEGMLLYIGRRSAVKELLDEVSYLLEV
jgi:hypothetical protein